MSTLAKVIAEIRPLDLLAMQEAQGHLDSLVKPIGSLGKLERIVVRLAGIQGRIVRELPRKCIVIMSADNGVWEEGVTTCPQEFTAIQTLNFTKGICGINVLARHAGADLRIVNIGVKQPLEDPRVINRKIRPGTWNMAKGPAMTKDEAIQGIETGIEQVAQLAAEGYGLLGVGEMGAGNTSTSSAILMAFSDCGAAVAVGKGAGLTEQDYANKQAVITKALEVNRPDPDDAVDVLAKVGGFDIAGLVGCFLGAAYYRIPIVIDGFIAAAAALVAYKLSPLTREFMIPSHASAEPGYLLVMRQLRLKPLFDLGMRLGEGTGCPFTFGLVDAAIKISNEMATFAAAAVQNDFLVDIREE
jgi:nicotinate-nucleotide--dimethylbenzimidazole phosphoribosyltransferase